jgi:Cu-processing system ATP-binding protein
MNNQILIQASHLSKKYAEFPVLDNISFELQAGEVKALLGHNGAGKSSLIKILLGLVTPDSGYVSVLGQSIRPAAKWRLKSAKLTQLSIGYLPEKVQFYANMTGFELLCYFADLKQVNHVKVQRLLAEFELEYAAHKLISTYSNGMKQRLGLAQAILAEPKILLLDEPTIGLDPLASHFLYQKVAQLKSDGCAVLICTHELSLVESQMDSALLLGQGKLLAQGSLTSLRQQSGLEVVVHCRDLAQCVAKDDYLKTFYQPRCNRYAGDCLLVNEFALDGLISYLTKHKQVVELSIQQPNINDIFHHFMAQLPPMSVNNTGWSSLTKPDPRGAL